MRAMGMTMKARRVRATTLETATSDDLRALVQWGEPGLVDIDKAWDGIAWLISVERRERPYMLPDPSLPETQAVYGVDPEDSALLFRYSPARVQRIADALGPLGDDALRAHFDPAAMQDADVYPRIWDEGEGAFEYLLSHFHALRRLYLDAAAAGDGLVTLID